MVAVFDFNANAIVLFVKRFNVALHIGKDLVEPVFVSGNLLSEKIVEIGERELD